MLRLARAFCHHLIGIFSKRLISRTPGIPLLWIKNGRFGKDRVIDLVVSISSCKRGPDLKHFDKQREVPILAQPVAIVVFKGKERVLKGWGYFSRC
jgi:hypothetical protein